MGKENSMDEQMILDLRAKGKSLRQIVSVLGLSHEGVRRRLKGLESKNRMSTDPDDRRLTASGVENEEVSTGSNARKSTVCEQVRDALNQV